MVIVSLNKIINDYVFRILRHTIFILETMKIFLRNAKLLLWIFPQKLTLGDQVFKTLIASIYGLPLLVCLIIIILNFFPTA